jgi:hypothetical protein
MLESTGTTPAGVVTLLVKLLTHNDNARNTVRHTHAAAAAAALAGETAVGGDAVADDDGDDAAAGNGGTSAAVAAGNNLYCDSHWLACVIRACGRVRVRGAQRHARAAAKRAAGRGIGMGLGHDDNDGSDAEAGGGDDDDDGFNEDDDLRAAIAPLWKQFVRYLRFDRLVVPSHQNILTQAVLTAATELHVHGQLPTGHYESLDVLSFTRYGHFAHVRECAFACLARVAVRVCGSAADCAIGR